MIHWTWLLFVFTAGYLVGGIHSWIIGSRKIRELIGPRIEIYRTEKQISPRETSRKQYGKTNTSS